MKTLITFGDSITDMGRWRDADNHAFSLGVGYPLFLKEYFVYNNYNIDVINRGCGGDSTTDLITRLDNDVISNKPDFLTILIGTNDLWHQIEGNEVKHGNTIDKFEENYRYVIETTKNKHPNCKIFLLEPFFIRTEQKDRQKLWDFMESIKDYALVVKKLANEYKLDFISIQSSLDKVAFKHGVNAVLQDGIHPNVLGSKIIAEEIIKRLKPFIK